MPRPSDTSSEFSYTLTEFGSDGDRVAVRLAVQAMHVARAALDIPEIKRLSAETFVYIDHAGSQQSLDAWLDTIRRQSASERKAGMIIQDILVSGGLALVTGYLEGMPNPLPVPTGVGHGAQSAQTWALLGGSWRRIVLRQPRP